MNEIKGKFISLTGSLMTLYPDALKKSDEALYATTNKHWNELEPESWYPTSLFGDFIDNYISASITGEKAVVTLGKKVYPTIKKSVGFPPEIKTPLDLIVFEAEGFEMSHKGSDVRPRKFIQKKEGHVIVQAPAPGYNQKLYEGVFLGILEMFNVKSGKVSITKTAPEWEYEITW